MQIKNKFMIFLLFDSNGYINTYINICVSMICIYLCMIGDYSLLFDISATTAAASVIDARNGLNEDIIYSIKSKIDPTDETYGHSNSNSSMNNEIKYIKSQMNAINEELKNM